ncbi:UNVERIFIED_CONTAM: Acyltransferase-like protein, chloroplastic [Sesamum radiatum]|uniref:Acyltransferase-like protein, chloroplastic n=1 Tax=Sesamum radiatum TaxID=300843 RepID=A0AAW2RD53_SESRA
MAIAGTAVFSTAIPPLTPRHHVSPSPPTSISISISKLSVSASLIPTDKHPPQRSASSFTENGVLEKKSADTIPIRRGGESKDGRLTLKDYFEQCGELLVRCRSDGGGPRWFSPLPLDSDSRLKDSPLLLSLPGVDGVGLGLLLQHQRLRHGQDQLLPSREEAQRLHQVLPKCEIRVFNDSGHALFLEEGFNLVSILTGASFYRRGGRHDYVLDYVPPTPSEFRRVYEPQRWIEAATNPVMLSTLGSGKIVRSLAGIPSEGPVLYVGYHMMLGFELVPLVSRFWMERNILLRGVAHPMMFTKLREGRLPALSAFDTFRIMGAVPVSAANFYRLFSSKSHVLLYPGGMREALHRKGEEYKLFWPEQSEFVRMAAKFGAKIIPFGSVGEDDVGQLLLDYNDLRSIPYFKNSIEELTDEAVKLRNEAVGEVANQDVHLPIILPKVPGRFYYLFGKPIETQGRKQELKSREKAHELYIEVKAEVEKCLGYLKEKRENDPYRNIFARLAYQARHGFDSEVPTFDI